MACISRVSYTLPENAGDLMDEFTWPVLLVKIALAALGSVFSLAILQASSTRERIIRFALGTAGGVIFGQWQYKYLYPDLDHIFWEGLMGCLFAWAFVVYFILAAAAKTFASVEKLGDLLDYYRDIHAALRLEKLSEKKDSTTNGYGDFDDK